MDNFIDKLAQKFSPNDMIKANSAAEARETERLRKQVDEYNKLLQDMKIINLKQQESAQKVSDMLNQLQSRQSEQFAESGIDDAQLEELFRQTNSNIHTENVKVYRNVQAILDKGLEEVRGDTGKELEETNKKIKSVKTLMILTLIAVICDIVINLVQYMGIGF